MRGSFFLNTLQPSHLNPYRPLGNGHSPWEAVSRFHPRSRQAKLLWSVSPRTQTLVTSSASHASPGPSAHVYIHLYMCVCLSVHMHAQMISGETEGRFALTGTSDIGIPYAHVQELERFGHFGAQAGREGRCVPDAPPVLTAATAAVKAPCS